MIGLRSLTRATRGSLLLALSLPALIAVILGLARGHFGAIVANSAGFSLYLLAAALLRRAEHRDAQPEPSSARRDTPDKLAAACIVALATAEVAAFGAGKPLIIAALFGIGAFVGMYLSYGFDQRQPADVPQTAPGAADASELRDIIGEAERRIARIASAASELGDADLAYRLRGIAASAAGIVKEFARNPNEIRRCRKFLTVYLGGIEQVVAGYARTNRHLPSEQLDTNFRSVLVAIEDTFRDQHRRLIESDAFDLDVKMEVLANRLKHEGIV